MLMQTNEIISRLADIGWEGSGPDQGRNCLSYTENEDRSHEFFLTVAGSLKELAEQKGMNITINKDTFGNSYATLAGKFSRRVFICSHLDSVKRGGRYDGITGVAGGLRVLEKFIEEGAIPKKSITVAAFRSEESSVTGYGCFGSSVATGAISYEQMAETKHQAFADAPITDVLAKKFELNEDSIRRSLKNPYIKGDDIDAVIELHVEQSGALEYLNEPVGIVTEGIGGARRSKRAIVTKKITESCVENAKILRLNIKGISNHSGGTPMNGEKVHEVKMDLRKDALTAAARFLKNLNPKNLVKIYVPGGGSYNTVPGECVIELAIPLNSDAAPLVEKMRGHLLAGMDVKAEVISMEEKAIQLIQENVASAAMKVIAGFEEIGEKFAGNRNGFARATVGDISSEGSGVLKFITDQRYLDDDIGREMKREIDEMTTKIEKEKDVNVYIREEGVKSSSATPFVNAEILDIARKTHMEIFGKNAVEMGSMPGHDAARIINVPKDSTLLPGLMIFVRSLKGGISHNPAEYSSEEDIDAGVMLLYEVVKKLCFKKG